MKRDTPFSMKTAAITEGFDCKAGLAIGGGNEIFW
jgi:hypothetical protein